MSKKLDQSKMSKGDTSIVCTRVTKMKEDAAAAPLEKSSEGPTVSTWKKVMHFSKINKELLPMKAHFFFFFGGLAGVIPPLILYCKQRASVSMVGILFAVLPFVQCVSKPIAGAIADKWQKHKTVFLTSIVVLSVSLFSVNFIPDTEEGLTEMFNFRENITLISCDDSVRFSACPSNHFQLGSVKMEQLSCNVSNCDYSNGEQQSTSFTIDDGGNSKICLPYHSTWCQLYVNSSLVDSDFGLIALLNDVDRVTGNHSTKCSEFQVKSIITASNQSYELTKKTNTSNRCFQNSLKCLAKCSVYISNTEQIKHAAMDFRFEMVWLWGGCIIAWSAYSIILSISDAILMNTLGENRGAFGYTRLFSSIGWGLLSAISAQIIDWVSEGQRKKNYSPGFYIFFGFMICDLLTAIPMKVVISEKPKALGKDLSSIFKKADVIVFSVAVLLQGMVTGFLWTFVVVYANELNGNQLVIGLNYAVECFLSEIPFFLASGWIVNKLGHSHSMTLVLLITGIKTICYSFIYDAWYMLIIALIHGVTYGVLYSTLATYASIIAPQSVSASIQGIFQAILEGAGVGSGNLIGGFVYEKIGGRLAFRTIGSILIGISIIHWLLSYLLNRRSRAVSPAVHVQSTNAADHFVDVILELKTETNNQHQ